MDDRSVTETAAILGISRQHVLRLIASGRLAARKIGNQWAVNYQSILDYQAEKESK